MSSYNDTQEINKLYQEQTQIINAITILDNGGTVTSFVIASKDFMTSPMMAVSINTIEPSQTTLDTIYGELIDRHNAISQELEALGVTDAPNQPQRERSRIVQSLKS